jgi:hypothetical protein
MRLICCNKNDDLALAPHIFDLQGKLARLLLLKKEVCPRRDPTHRSNATLGLIIDASA